MSWNIIRFVNRKTTSEVAFETFLSENGLPFEKVEEQDSPRPDYLVQIGATKVFFEVKQLVADDNFTMHGSTRTIGNHIRRKIVEARKQLQFGANQGIPSVLLIYNKLDPLHLFGTENHDFISAMYGEYTLVLGRDSGKTLDRVHGKNQSLHEEKNTSFSALGHLSPLSGKLNVTLFENAFAKVKIPFDTLPSCFDVKKVEITRSEYVLPR